MKITKHIFIYTIFLCLAAQGSILSQICVEADMCKSDIDWASKCHAQTNASHKSHHSQESAFGHEDNKCRDITISSTSNSCNYDSYDDQLSFTKPIILKPTASDHPFSSFDFSKLKTNLLPIFTDTTSLSIKSTVLIV
jgi:hypothetical protein